MSIRPVAIISQSYLWDADDAVLERLVFFGNIAANKFFEDGNPIHATFKLRSVKTGEEGMFASVVRHAITGELVYEFTQVMRGQYTAMAFLTDIFLGGFELREQMFPKVPNMTENFAYNAGRNFAIKMRAQKKGQVSHERLTKEAEKFREYKISFVDGYMTYRKHLHT